MTQKNSKRTLVLSVLSIVLCVAMLIGTTFAWFTDNASTGVNSIQAGTLDVQLVDANGNSLDGKTLDFVKAEDAESEEILWEPGCTYSLPAVYVKNNGNLALKYKVDITGINGDAKLNEVIDWTINNADINTEYQLAAGATSEAIIISGHMQESAGNEYQGLKIEGIAITVAATQNTVEHDSFEKDYDTNAKYAFNTTVTVGTGEVRTIDLSEKDIDAGGYDGAVHATGGGQVTLTGEGNVVGNDDKRYAMAVWAEGDGSKVVINSGTYTNNKAAGNTDDQMDLIYASEGGDIEINGGTFKCVTPKWTLNIRDADHKSGSSTITVKGGTFYEYDPSNSTTESPAANFVAEGYKVITEEKADGTWYTVVPK